MTLPKITIITPNLNNALYLEQTIRSVLDQNYPNLEYIIVDGGSIDDSVEIIKKYEKRLAFWKIEKDNGLYDALQKGFGQSTGEIMGWLNSDDLLMPKSLWTIAELFTNFEEVEWIQGRPLSIGKDSNILDISELRSWSKYHYYVGEYRWIQQESTYWRRSLWEKCGSQLNTKLQLAGDFELWLRFFDIAQLYSANALIGGFRFRANQLSQQFQAQYLAELEQSLAKKLSTLSTNEKWKIRSRKLLYLCYRLMVKIGFDAYFAERFLLKKIFKIPPFLIYDVNKKQFIKSKYPRVKQRQMSLKKSIKNLLPNRVKSNLDRLRYDKVLPIDFGYLKLLENQEISTLKDRDLLEQLLLSLGLNDEHLEEFPEELYPYCGYGLRHWQYPKQFAPYLIHLAQYSIKSYLEIGVRHGGTFLITVNYLNYFNNIQRAIGVDIVKNSAFQDYCAPRANHRFLQIDSNSQSFQRFIAAEERFDLILIDGNHEEAYCRKDFETIKNHANMIAFHDIVSDACPGVRKIWQEVKNKCSETYEFYEFIEQYESVQQRTGQSFLGIGLAVRKDFIQEKEQKG